MDVIEIQEGLKLPGKSRAGLAEILGVDVSQVSRLLNGKRHLKVHELEKIRDYIYGENGAQSHARGRAETAAVEAQIKLFNLEIIRDLLDDADRCGIDIAKTIAESLRTAVAEKKRDRWLRDNAAAIEQYNRRVVKRGTYKNGATFA